MAEPAVGGIPGSLRHRKCQAYFQFVYQWMARAVTESKKAYCVVASCLAPDAPCLATGLVFAEPETPWR